MKKDIKEEIIQCAKELFNQYGYNQVTMRMIADSLNISVGNLTYHYKKKEYLVETIILTQHSYYVKFPTPHSFLDLHQLFIKIMNHQKNNAFYYRSYTQIGELSEKVKQIQDKVMIDLHESLNLAFEYLINDQLIRPDLLPLQIESLVHVLMLICIHDISVHSENRLVSLWLLIHPILNEKGKALFSQQIKL